MEVLDAGCADGEYTQLLSCSGAIPYGIDLSSSAIKKAKQGDPLGKYKTGPLEKLFYKKDKFEVVLCSETLEHVLDYDKSLDELCRVCKNYLIISVPIEKSHPFVRLGLKVLGKKDMIPSDTHADAEGFEDLKGGHLREFTSTSIDRDLEARGFRIIKKRKIHNSALVAVFFVLSEKLTFLNSISKPMIKLINLADKLFPWWGLTYVVVAKKTSA